MRTIYKLIIAIFVVGFITYYTTSSVKENKALEGPQVTEPLPQQQLEEQVNALERPSEGVSTFVGQSSDAFLAKYGEPQRKDLSKYDDEWWIYNTSYDAFMMVGITAQTVTQVYVGGEHINMHPFYVQQPIDELYRSMIIQSEVNVPIGDNLYSFTLSEEDLHTRLLIAYEGMYAQVYLHEDTSTVQAVRFIDAKTLVAQQPYEMMFMGELVTIQPPTSFQQQEIHAGQTEQLIDLVNVARTSQDLLPLIMDDALQIVAQQHSEEMAQEGYLSNESPTKGDIKEQLKTADIAYETAGSNVAISYVDAIEAMHGWINSASHYELMIDDAFTHVGAGVFLDNYTQIFIEQQSIE